MKGCRRARRRILLAVDGELPVEEQFALEAHVARCTSCAAEHARARALQELLMGVPEPPLERQDLDAACHSIHRKIAAGSVSMDLAGSPSHGSRERASAPLAGRRRLAWAAGLLALVGSGSFVAAWLRSRASEPAAGSSGASIAAVEPRDVALGSGDESGVPKLAGGSASDRNSPRVDPDEHFVEGQVRASLLELVRDARLRAAPERFARRFEESLRPFRGWPVEHMVRRQLVDPNAELASAAALYLGECRNPLSATALANALGRAELVPQVLQALGRHGEDGLPGMERLLGEPAWAALALREMSRVGGERAARSIEIALRRRLSPRSDASLPMATSYLAALARCGPAAVAPMVRLADDLDRGRASGDGLELDDVFRALSSVEDGAHALADWIDSQGLPEPSAVLFEALARLQPLEALAWLEERCTQYRYRHGALACLARWEGTAPVEALLRLDRGGAVPDEELAGALARLARADGERIGSFAHGLIRAGDHGEIERAFELLVASSEPNAASGLLVFALSESVTRDVRQLSALSVGELGGADEGRALLEGFAQLGPADRRLAAAFLISIHSLLGESGTLEALGGFSSSSVRRTRVALEDVEREGSSAGGWNRVARALEDGLVQRQQSQRSSTL